MLTRKIKLLRKQLTKSAFYISVGEVVGLLTGVATGLLSNIPRSRIESVSKVLSANVVGGVVIGGIFGCLESTPCSTSRILSRIPYPRVKKTLEIILFEIIVATYPLMGEIILDDDPLPKDKLFNNALFSASFIL